ncbi:alcohol dehydrogenase [Mycena venus]|uniref:Alcohol dehydrogenase n=1 Tax=Mycena venus TaxID=2733690 RepID=A0A8H6X5J9_9AGAR|nr:alcohol dehydrogenase [Mycena venus]
MTSVPTTMLAAVYEPGNIDLVLNKEYPLRALEDDEILLKVSACGVCHTDTFFLSGFTLDTRTYVMGHEISGTPVLLGDKVDQSKIQLGQLYSVLSPAHGQHAPNGGPVFNDIYGIGLDGGYAEYIIVKDFNVVPVPAGVTPEAAAVAGDAGTTAYNAVKHTAGQGSKVLIFGVGGLGHLAVQYAKHLGATVYVCDFKPEARQLALDVGADEAFSLINLSNKTAAGFTVDSTIDFIANTQTFNLAMASLSGNDIVFPEMPRLVLVGVSADNLVFAAGNTIVAGVQILSSAYGPENALEEVLDLFAEGIVQAHITVEPLENVNKAINDLRAYRTTGRKVVVPQ